MKNDFKKHANKYLVAVLITCHNRKTTTLKSLEYLYKNELEKAVIDVYLVDDGSTDGTSKAVKKYYPRAHVIHGKGNLFWNKGMRLAWVTAIKNKKYDFFIWLNDDTMIDEDGMSHLFECYYESYKHTNIPTLVVGACRKNGTNHFSYGGRDEVGRVIPNGTINKCKYVNGNFVLVPKEVVNKIGILSNDYTHTMGDWDYGLRALKNGYDIITTKKYVATCPINNYTKKWCDPKESLFTRWKSFHSPLGLNIVEYRKFRKKYWGNQYFSYLFKAYIKCLAPAIYNYIDKK